MVYLHVPFCRSFCTYCDFFSEIACKGRDEGKVEAYASGVCREIEARRAEIEATRAYNTLYVGGGTPSVLPLACLGRIVSCLGGAPFTEFTVEVNPEDIVLGGEEYVRGLKALGATRVSMGVQSLDDGMLRWMNRRHTAARAREAFGLLRSAGFDNISLDIIFGISHLTDGMLADTLEGLLELGPEHISAYQLSVEDGSALAQMVESGRYSEAGEEQCRRQYEQICALLSEAGYEHYEISNWALPGFRAVHNSAYWKRTPYVGLGPGAHSLIGHRRSWNSQTLGGWTSDGEDLTPEQERCEAIMLGLRTAEGFEGKRIPEKDWFISDTLITDYL